jgi:WD repeat-containing protein 49
VFSYTGFSFGQVVSVSSGVVKVWNLGNGEKLFQFNNLHNSEITSACFDKTHRRLLTACRGGEVKMWNFNNGQMLQKMTVSSGLDITHVMYIQTAHDKFILSAGWDKKISIFLDEPGNFNAIPFREFADIAYGHQCDILTADISSNHSVLATGDIGGQICIWNFDSGRLKAQFTINDIKSKGMRERSVEKLFFMPKANSLRSIKSELVVSTHADGFIRIWDYEQRVMIHESDCRFNLGDGIKSLKLSKGSEYIICGNLSGFVRVFKCDNTSLREVCSWMAHEGSCLSIDFIDEYACILTSSDDLTAKIWTLKGIIFAE